MNRTFLAAIAVASVFACSALSVTEAGAATKSPNKTLAPTKEECVQRMVRNGARWRKAEKKCRFRQERRQKKKQQN